MFYISTMNIQSIPYYQYQQRLDSFKGFGTSSFSNYSSFSMEEEEPKLYTIPVELWHTAYGFRMPVSEEMIMYKGKKGDAGLSTEAGGFGGGWIISDINTPLSTRDMHGCAVLNLINSETNKQLLYHVYEDSGSGVIEQFIKEKFPKFDKVNITPGDAPKTSLTMNKILTAVDNINSDAQKTFYHTQTENPEIVTIDGKLEYIDNPTGKMSFREECFYNY